MPRLPRFKWSGKSAQSKEREETRTPNEAKSTDFLGILGFRSTSRSPSPRPPSPAPASPGQSEQRRKPSEAFQNHNAIATVPAESPNQLESNRGSPKLPPEETGTAESGGQNEHHKAEGPKEPQQQAPPHDPSEEGGDNGLWAKAYDKLPDELKQHLVAVDKLQTLKEVLQTAIDAQEANIANRGKFKWGDKEIDMQETAGRLVGWIVKFKEVGDIAVQYDPVHAALPWAGVRFILLVRSTIPSLYSGIY